MVEVQGTRSHYPLHLTFNADLPTFPRVGFLASRFSNVRGLSLYAPLTQETLVVRRAGFEPARYECVTRVFTNFTTF